MPALTEYQEETHERKLYASFIFVQVWSLSQSLRSAALSLLIAPNDITRSLKLRILHHLSLSC